MHIYIYMYATPLEILRFLDRTEVFGQTGGNNLTKQKLSSMLIRSCELCDRHIGARSALKVTLEYAKCNLAAPAQKNTTVQYRSSAQSMFWQLQRACSSPIIWCLLFLFGSKIRQNINSGKRYSFLFISFCSYIYMLTRVLCIFLTC